ncbi:MAG: Crp/Fnr family transcriptional regulator [Candidatus Acidiferrales bacterium]
MIGGKPGRPGELRRVGGKPAANKILLSLPKPEFLSICNSLEYVDLPRHAILHEPSKELDFVYFSNGGLISLVVAMEDGKTVEAGVVGKEGVVGTPLAVGLHRTPLRAIVQIPSSGFRIRAAALQAALPNAAEFQMTLSRYAVIQGLQVSQTAACNRLHDVEQRLSRWLLMAVDRVYADLLPVTHDFLATLLGTDRPSVTLAAGVLQKKRAIEYTRGTVKVLNRATLQDSACECYRVIQNLDGELGLP